MAKQKTKSRLPDLIVVRHPGAVEWLAEKAYSDEPGADGRYCAWDYTGTPGLLREFRIPALHEPTEFTGREVPVRAEVTADDVRGKVVWGVLPLHLAALCREYHAIEFGGRPPRGAEYTADDMDGADARLVHYVIMTEAQARRWIHTVNDCGDQYHSNAVVQNMVDEWGVPFTPLEDRL